MASGSSRASGWTRSRRLSVFDIPRGRAEEGGAESDARSRGYYLNPDQDFLKDLLEGIRKNEERYGYPACPCRLASGNFELDKDIICPCDYRDPDCEEFGTCYCGLYVTKDVFEGRKPLESIPERRPLEKQTRAYAASAEAPSTQPAVVSPVTAASTPMKQRLWYCKQCGYVVFREEPPYMCPICKAKREFFAEIRIEVYSPGLFRGEPERQHGA